MNSSVDNASMNVHKCEKCLKLETELLNKKDFIEKETYDKLDNSVSNKSALSIDQYFELNDMKAQSQEKDMVIKKLKERIKSLSGNMNEDKVKKDLEEIETINIELDHRVLQEKVLVITALKDELSKLKGKALADNVVCKHTIDPEMLKIDVEYLNPRLLNNSAVEPKGNANVKHSKLNANSEPLCVKCNGCMLFDNHDLCVLDFINDVNAHTKSKSVKKSSKRKVIQIVLWYLDSGCSKHMIGDRSQLTNFVNKFLGTVKFGNDHVPKILEYGNYQIGNITISRVYYVEGLGHNLFSVGQFCDSNFEVAFRQHTCFIHNLEGVDLLIGSRGNTLYTPSLGDMMTSSSICLLSKASKTKSWLWHRCLSYLNFSAINHLARHGLVREAVSTACYTQNRSIIRLRHDKTPYGILHDKLPDLSFFHVFGALCYLTNDSENLGKLQLKADIGIFIGYAPTKKAFRIYNQCTRQIIETTHVDFDELTAMASEHSSSRPALHEMTPATISSGLVPNPSPSTPFVPPSRTDYDILFQPMFDELLTPPPSVDYPTTEVVAPIHEVVAPVLAVSTGSPSSTNVDQDAPWYVLNYTYLLPLKTS
ncbi:retrovirus-related pol polyprotein from transposon TNT 1-94 [Tanacetum coccineum]